MRVPVTNKAYSYVDPRLIDHGSVIELFYDAVGLNDDTWSRQTRWLRSAGVEWHGDWEFSTLRFQPTIGFAKRLTDDESWQWYTSFGYRW